MFLNSAQKIDQFAFHENRSTNTFQDLISILATFEIKFLKNTTSRYLFSPVNKIHRDRREAKVSVGHALPSTIPIVYLCRMKVIGRVANYIDSRIGQA